MQRLCMLAAMMLLPGMCAASAPRSRALERASPVPLAFSAPYSRVVIHPFLNTPPPADDGISLDMAVYAGEQPVRLPSAWTWQTGVPTRVARELALPVAPKEWEAEDVTPDFGPDGVRVTLKDAPYGALTVRVTVNLDHAPYLALNVGEVAGAWALKIAPEDAGNREEHTDILLQPDTAASGARIFNVRRATGWTGTKTFRVRLFVVGGKGKAVRFANMRFLDFPTGRDTLRVTASTWAPDRLTQRAVAPNGRMLDARTTLAGEGTVWQSVRAQGGERGMLVLVGQWPQGPGYRVDHDTATGEIVLEAPDLHGRIRLSRPARWLGVYSNWADWLTRNRSASSAGGVWAVALDGVSPGDEVVLRADYLPVGNAAMKKASAPTVAAARAAFRASETAWNARLARVPRPLSFALRHAPSKGVAPEDVERTYYDAWAFLFADILPPMPENNYPYPQVACGKPSLWGEGHPKARASAQWESIAGMQFLALVEPEAAWRSLEGMMTLVDADGSMAGEGLPSWHMQTAWTLYALTGDTHRMRALYPAMKRLLHWKAADPRWIHMGATPPGTKDIEFVVHAVLDMDYATRIARALNISQDVNDWETRRAALAANYRRWFFGPPGHTVYRIYEARKDERSGPDNAWSLEGIALPLSDAGAEGRDAMLRLFDQLCGQEESFLIPNYTKHPHYSLTARGLWRHGRPNDLARLTDTYLRDVVRAGQFAEWYLQEDPPIPTGVRPSLFGALIAIEGAMWRNGVTLSEGFPALANVPDAAGVENLRVRGKPLDVRFGPRNQVTLSGPARGYFRRPVGFEQIRGTWRGALPDATLLTLTPSIPGP